MKADLYTAQARTAGASGLAHRTAAGFVVLTSADGDDIIALIEENQNEADLIDQVVATAQTNGPAAFVMVFTAGGELYVIASGAARLVLTSPSADITMRPADAQVLVHALSAGLNEAAANLRLYVHDVDDDATSETALQAGTVEADWVEVAIGGAALSESDSGVGATDEPEALDVSSEEAEPEAEPAPAPAPEVAALPDPIPLTSTPPAEPAPTPEVAALPDPIPLTSTPAPTAEPAAEPAPGSLPDPIPLAGTPAPAPAQVGPVMVLGVACSQAHHNHPDAVYCSQCGTKMGVHHTVVLINGPRPPLGVLVVDDGTTYSLNEDLVIGREPTSHADVIAGTASPMILTDDTLSLSRKHARIVLDDWLVAVQDLNSSNGTFLSRAGQSESWSKIKSGTTMSLEPGDRLRVGGRIIQVELHHVR